MQNNRNSDFIHSTKRQLPHIRLSLPSASSTPDLLFIPSNPITNSIELTITGEEGDVGDSILDSPVSPTFTLSSTLPRSNVANNQYIRRSSTSNSEPLLSLPIPSPRTPSHNPFLDVDTILEVSPTSPLTTESDTTNVNGAGEINNTLADAPPPRGSIDLAEEKRRRRESRNIVESLALDRFRKWMVCFCIVNFDLEIGQAMDFVYPPVEFTELEKKNICFSAFPDSNVFEVGDTVYNFRTRSNSESGFAASGPTADAGFLYGYVFFRQKKDPRIRRGYFQKSVVLISQYPFIGLFSRLISILGPAFCDVGKPMLEAACHNIATWKPPVPGQYYELPFLGSVIQVEIPQPHKPQLLETSPFDMEQLSLETQILASVPIGTLYWHFKDILEDLWLCWELMLLAEPLVVMAPDPCVCSESVVALIDMISPIPYCGDYRPYFTIQDSDFKSFVTKNQPPSHLILGVTNPFFNTALDHWPTIIRVGRPKPRKPDGSLMIHKAKSGKSGDFVQGATSKRKSVIAKDRAILKMFTEAAVRGVPAPHILNNILRRYFVDLTEKFLVPLNRYFSTLIPVNMNLSGKLQPQLKPFSTDNFMKSLKEHGPQLPFKSDFSTRVSATDVTKELYSHFLKCGNFATWLRLRMQEAQRELRKKHLQLLCDADVHEWMRGRHEVELVDLLLKVKQELQQGNEPAQTSSKDSFTTLSTSPSASPTSFMPESMEERPTPKQLERLRAQADVIIMGLPKDLRETLSLGNGIY